MVEVHKDGASKIVRERYPDECMTSPNEMAACFMSSDEGGGNLGIFSIFEGKIKDLLKDVNDNNHQETSKAICAGYTKSALLDFRQKLFAIAYKFETEKNVGGATRKDASSFDADDRSRRDISPVRDSGLVNRRVKPLVADDCIALALFAKDPKGPFPKQVLKRKDSAKKKEFATGDAPETNVGSDASDSDPEENSEYDTIEKPLTAQRRIERFVIREEVGTNSGNL